MKRVLVTGASGFIGRFACEALERRGFCVVRTARRPPEGAAGDWRACDLLDAQARERLVAETAPAHLLHLAWYAEPGLYWESAENPKWLEATRALARAFGRAGGRRFVGAGSCAEYDWRRLAGPCREDETPVLPATLYGRCKEAARAAVQEEAARGGFSWAWGRIFFLYGPFEPPARFAASIITALLRGQEAGMSHGRQVRDLLHVADVGEAFAALCDAPSSGVVNVGSGEGVTLADVGARLAARLGAAQRLRVGALEAAAGEPPLLVADVSRLRALGFAPRFSLDAGLDDAVRWWRERLSPGKREAGRR